ncbi:MAG: L,D-transpeptidase family protein [Thermomicrobiales bacterium]
MEIWHNSRPTLRSVPHAIGFAVAAFLCVGLLLPIAVGAESPMAGPSIVYFPATGHNVAGDILQFWHENGGADQIGNPITEEVKDGKTIKQYFERGVVEYSPSTGLSFGRIGVEFVFGRHDSAFMPRTRDEYGTDRDGRRFFSETGHGITGPFVSYWEQYGGLGVFGFPLSEPTREIVGDAKDPTLVQYFERARFELIKGVNGQDIVRLGNLGREAAVAQALVVNPVPKDGGAMEYSASIWPKWIDVNLKTQHLVAYEGNAVAQQFDVTSGTPKNPTPTGVFQLFAKVKSERMKGDIGLPTQYDIKNVPWTMYFAGGGYAIHGAPWRSVYGPGTELDGSHGCLNSPVSQADILYQWAPLGTTVIIHF